MCDVHFKTISFCSPPRHSRMQACVPFIHYCIVTVVGCAAAAACDAFKCIAEEQSVISKLRSFFRSRSSNRLFVRFFGRLFFVVSPFSLSSIVVAVFVDGVL